MVAIAPKPRRRSFAKPDLGVQLPDDFVISSKPSFEASTPEDKAKNGRLGRLVFEFKTADVINGNRRIYPESVFLRAFESFVGRVTNNKIFGKLDHPGEYDPNCTIVTLDDACVKVSEASLKSNVVKLTFDILDNDIGERLVSVLKVGGNPGTSQRATAIWREPTAEERKQYGVPDGQWVVVADVLRLITYDIVSEQAFPGADDAEVLDHQNGEVPMNLEALKTQHPALYQQIILEGRNAALAEVDAKVAAGIAAAKPTIVTEATGKLTTDLAAAKGQSDKLIAALTGLKPLMTELKIVNEHITDAQAATRIATLEAKVNEIEGKLKTANDALAAEQTAHTQSKNKLAAFESIRQVATVYANDPDRKTILDQIQANPPTDPAKALEAAKAIKDLITAARGNNGGGNGQGAPGQPQLSIMDVLTGNYQNPQSGSGGGNGQGFGNANANQQGNGGNGQGNNGQNQQAANEAQALAAARLVMGGLPAGV